MDPSAPRGRLIVERCYASVRGTQFPYERAQTFTGGGSCFGATDVPSPPPLPPAACSTHRAIYFRNKSPFSRLYSLFYPAWPSSCVRRARPSSPHCRPHLPCLCCPQLIAGFFSTAGDLAGPERHFKTATTVTSSRLRVNGDDVAPKTLGWMSAKCFVEAVHYECL